jgi:hypothetical protein
MDEFPHKWKHTQGGTIMHVKTGLCIDATDVKNGQNTKMETCDESKPGQKWEFEKYL